LPVWKNSESVLISQNKVRHHANNQTAQGVTLLRCGGELLTRWKQNSHYGHSPNSQPTPFFGCSNYPDCSHTEGIYDRMDFSGIETRVMASMAGQRAPVTREPEAGPHPEDHTTAAIWCLTVLMVMVSFGVMSAILTNFHIAVTVDADDSKTYFIQEKL